MSETRHVDFDGHRVAYRVAGEGPALVVLNLYRRRQDVIQLRVLSDVWQVFEIAAWRPTPRAEAFGRGSEDSTGRMSCDR